MAEKETAMVPASDLAGKLCSVGGQQLNVSFICSLDPSDKDYRKTVFHLRQAKGKSLREAINKEIKIVSVLAFQGTVNDEKTGEIVDTVICKMMLDDGTLLETHSNAIRKTLALAAELLGPPSKKSPWVCTPVSRPMRDQTHAYFDLVFPV